MKTFKFTFYILLLLVTFTEGTQNTSIPPRYDHSNQIKYICNKLFPYDIPGDSLLTFINKFEYFNYECNTDCPEFYDSELFLRPNEFIRKADFAARMPSSDSIYLIENWKDSIYLKRKYSHLFKTYYDYSTIIERNPKLSNGYKEAIFYSLQRFLEVSATYKLYAQLLNFDFNSFNKNKLIDVKCIKEYPFNKYYWLDKDTNLIDDLIKIIKDEYELNDVDRYTLILSHFSNLFFDTSFMNRAIKDPIINFLHSETFSDPPNKNDLNFLSLLKMAQFNSLDQYVLQQNSCNLFTGKSFDGTSLLDKHYHKTVVFEFNDFKYYCRSRNEISITEKESQDYLLNLNKCLIWYATLGVDTTEDNKYLTLPSHRISNKLTK